MKCLTTLFAWCALSLPVHAWEHYGGDLAGTRFVPESLISRNNIGDLKLAWHFRTGDATDGEGYFGNRSSFKATPILCAYKVGGSQAVFDLSVDYSRERRQFGQPIGRFQHVQNHIIQLVNYVDAARWTTYEALWTLDSGRAGADVSMHMAKAVASEGYVQATNYAHEVHAGVGVMREYGLTLFTRLSRSLYSALGDPQYHRRALGDLLVDYEAN